MLKGIVNIFLVFIISVTAAGMPVDINAFNFSTYIPDSENDVQLSYTIDSQDSNFINPKSLDFIIKSDTSIDELTSEEKESFILEILKENQEPITYSASDFIISQEISNDTEIIMTLDLSQNNLLLQDGSYQFKFYSNHKNFSQVTPLELEITYKPISPYIAAKDTMSRGLMNLTLYFPDKNKNYLIPITRFVSHTTAAVRTTVNNLHEGSADLGLENPIPNIPRLQVSNGTLTVHLPSNLGKYNESESDGYFALNSIVNSLTAVPGVDRVKFLVNGRESDDFFYGHSTSPIYEADMKIPKSFLAMDIDQNRTLLVPVNLHDYNTDTILTDIFNILQTGIYNGKTLVDLFPTIPGDIKLLDATLVGSTVKLNLSKDILYTYPEREDLQKLMIDSILFSYTSIPSVENVQFLVEDQSVDNFAGFRLSQPLSKPKYINPEEE